MSVETRQPGEEHLDTFRHLMKLAFNPPRQFIEQVPPPRLEHMLCAFDGDRLVASSRDLPMVQWFGGTPLRVAGISSVATLPEIRGTGIGDELLPAILPRSRERGAGVTLLFPA